jgi:C-terminal processing protease CtpA/Prc
MSPLRASLIRWRTARRIVLGSLVAAGALATAAAMMSRGCAAKRARAPMIEVSRAVFGGVGIQVSMVDGQDAIQVQGVLAGSPADGVIHPGAFVLAVDGNTPRSFPEWVAAIRGEVGTTVKLDVAYPCGGERTVELTRALIHHEE